MVNSNITVEYFKAVSTLDNKIVMLSVNYSYKKEENSSYDIDVEKQEVKKNRSVFDKDGKEIELFFDKNSKRLDVFFSGLGRIQNGTLDNAFLNTKAHLSGASEDEFIKIINQYGLKDALLEELSKNEMIYNYTKELFEK